MWFPSLPWEIAMDDTKYFERTLILNPWAGKFYPFFFFAVTFNSGFTIKLQNKERCFRFCAMGKGLPNTIR